MTEFNKTCTKTFTRIDGGMPRVCGKPFTTKSLRLDWCNECMEAFIAKSIEVKAAVDRYRAEQRAAGRVKLAGQWTYDTTEEETTR